MRLRPGVWVRTRAAKLLLPTLGTGARAPALRDGRDPSPAAAPRKKKKKRAGPFAGQRRPLGKVDANGVPLDELVRLGPSASSKGRRDAIPDAAWTWLAGFD